MRGVTEAVCFVVRGGGELVRPCVLWVVVCDLFRFVIRLLDIVFTPSFLFLVNRESFEDLLVIRFFPDYLYSFSRYCSHLHCQ